MNRFLNMIIYLFIAIRIEQNWYCVCEVAKKANYCSILRQKISLYSCLAKSDPQVHVVG